jgi:PIN domain
VLYVLADTSVWLDLAKDLNGQKLIVAVRVLAHEGRVTLLVPQIVLDEFERNRSRVEADMTRGLSATFRRVRDEIEQHGQDKKDAALTELDNLTQRVPLINQIATRNFDGVRDLLANGRRLSPTADDREGAVQRALDGRAPFHRSRNSMADALIVEMYAASVDAASDADDSYRFVSANVKDFSAIGDDNRLPHSDLAPLFDGNRSGYFLSVVAALAEHFPEDFDDMLAEFDFHEEPRNWEEIREAEEEMFDRVWYNRSLYFEHRAEEEGGDIEAERRITGPPRARVEAKYGAENLGPYLRVGDDQRQAVGAPLGHRQRVGLPRYLADRIRVEERVRGEVPREALVDALLGPAASVKLGDQRRNLSRVEARDVGREPLLAEARGHDERRRRPVQPAPKLLRTALLVRGYLCRLCLGPCRSRNSACLGLPFARAFG